MEMRFRQIIRAPEIARLGGEEDTQLQPENRILVQIKSQTVLDT